MNAAIFYPVFLKANGVTIDSRKVKTGDVFFAFSGESFDAATLAEDAVNRGAVAVIVENEAFANASRQIFYVPSTLEFLQGLASYHRQQLDIPVIALTGSNGKTTTKEIIHAVLSQKYNVQFTQGNLNNHIGVPLTLLSINKTHEMAVVEMGANHQKEIEFLCGIAKPTIGYITNFGKAHLEGFGGVEGVIKGKSELYEYLQQNDGKILLNENDQIQLEKTAGYPHLITFGRESSDYFFNEINEQNFVGLNYKAENALSHLTGAYNFTNLCAAASLGFHFGLNFTQIKTGIENYQPQNMRSQIMQKAGKTLVLDTYNANPSSMTEALKNFSNFEGSKTVIMGDMLELGEESDTEHASILCQAESLGFEEIITVGENFKKINNISQAYSNAAEFIEMLRQNPLTSKNILLKASRGIALEAVLDYI